MWFMIKVTFGEHDRCDDKTRPETRFVLRAISQPFSFSNFDNDVALLRLNDRVPITEFIRPICLPTKSGKCHQHCNFKEDKIVADKQKNEKNIYGFYIMK